MGNAQRLGKKVALIDAEHALDPAWAEVLGVDTDDLYLSQPNSGEQALQIADKLVTSGLFSVITVDSVAALVPQAELNGEIGDSHIGLQARMMSQALRVLAGKAHESGTTVIFINQLREKVGVFFGSSETQPGGKALKFYASVRLDVRRISTIKDKDEAVGSRVRVKVVKNKLGRPFQNAEFDFLFGVGISRMGELLDLGVERKVVRKSGAFYSLSRPGGSDTMSLGQGKFAARTYLDSNPDVAAQIEQAVRAAAGSVPLVLASKEPAGRVEMPGPAPWDSGGSGTETVPGGEELL